MKTYHTHLILTLLLSLCPLWAEAQQLLWNVDFSSFFDNREYTPPIQTAQTFFGTRLSPELGVRIGESNELLGGVSWIREFGATKQGKVDATLYYRYTTDRFKAAFGAFPRKLLVEEYPAAMVYDSLLYFRPNIGGALFQYFAPTGYVEAYIDWRSRQTETKREVFTLASSGRFRQSVFMEGWYLMLTHFARTKNPPEGTYVYDNIVVNPYVGLDLSRRTVFDSLTVKTGALVSLDRNRGDGIWHHPAGFLGELTLEWRWLGLKEVFYAGKRHLTFYDEFGSLLHTGDPFYRQKSYSRTDLYGYFFRNRWAECKASVNFHVAGGRLHTQQQLLLRFNINQQTITKKPAPNKAYQ